LEIVEKGDHTHARQFREPINRRLSKYFRRGGRGGGEINLEGRIFEKGKCNGYKR
jgi:hypothetical protein